MCFIGISYCYLAVDKLSPKKPSAKKTKVGKEVKEVIEPEMNQKKISTIFEETITTNPDDFLDTDRDLDTLTSAYYQSSPITSIDVFSKNDYM